MVVGKDLTCYLSSKIVYPGNICHVSYKQRNQRIVIYIYTYQGHRVDVSDTIAGTFEENDRKDENSQKSDLYNTEYGVLSQVKNLLFCLADV